MVKKAKSAKQSNSNAWRTDPEVKSILAECTGAVVKGLNGKSLTTNAQTALENRFGPKIYKKLHLPPPDTGDWNADRVDVLAVAKNLGQIAALLAKGTVVSSNIAQAAALAIGSDEHCTRTGGGGGDWCYD